MSSLAQRDLESIMTLTQRESVAPHGVVVELTEHEQVRDIDALTAAVGRLRRHKVALALDEPHRRANFEASGLQRDWNQSFAGLIDSVAGPA